MAMTYNKTNWENGKTPLNADNMNNIENGITDCVSNINALRIDTDKKIEEPSTNGIVRKYMAGMVGTMGVDTTTPTTPNANNLPTSKLMYDELAKIDKDFELVVKHTVTADDGETSFYFSKIYIEDDNGVATTGADFEYKDIVISVNIPVIDSSVTTNQTGTAFTIINSNNVSSSNLRVSAFNTSWRQNIAANIGTRVQIQGGRAFSQSGYSGGNTSNITTVYGGQCNIGTVEATSINSILFHIYGFTFPKDTVFKIYAR